VRRAGDRVGSDRLGDPRRRPVEHRRRRLWCDVAGRDTGAAGREHEARAAVCQLLERPRDLLALVRHDAALDLVALAGEQLVEQVAAPVLARALVDAVGHGQHGDPHTGSLVFSIS
jgi:hypothetical protein